MWRTGLLAVLAWRPAVRAARRGLALAARRARGHNGSAMFVLLVYVHVKPEHLEAFRLATVENARASRLEPGVARFDFLQETDDPTRFALVEVYRGRDGHAQHRETPHYKAWAAAAAEWLAEPRTRTAYYSVDPADGDW